MGIKLVVAAKTDVGRVRTNNEDAFLIANLARRGDRRRADRADRPSTPHERRGRARRLRRHGRRATRARSRARSSSSRCAAAVDERARGEEGKTGTTRSSKQAVEHGEREVFDAAKDPGKRGMGATRDRRLRPRHRRLHRRDRRLARVPAPRARIRQMTRDQSFVQFLRRRGAISPRKAANYPHKNIVLQAMGSSQNVRSRSAGSSCAAATGSALLRRPLEQGHARRDARDRLQREHRSTTACAAHRARRTSAAATTTHGRPRRAERRRARVHRDEESMTQTFEVVKAGPNTDIKSDRPPPPALEEAPRRRRSSARAAERLPSRSREDADMKTRPLQLAVAVVMMAIMAGVVSGRALSSEEWALRIAQSATEMPWGD